MAREEDLASKNGLRSVKLAVVNAFLCSPATTLENSVDDTKQGANSCGLQVQSVCHGDDFWGMPRAVLSAGWHPRNVHGTRLRRPALPEGPAAPAAGWRLHRGEPEPGDEDKVPPTAVSPKVAWPPTRLTGAKDGHDASHIQTPPTSEKEPSPRKDLRQKGGHMPPRCQSKGEKALYKVPSSDEDGEGQKIMPKMQPRRSRQPGSRPPNL
jgi:hypothetical protein